MITEDYCSCGIARLIKEKGLVFAEHTSYIPKYNADGTAELITTITHQTAMKWLREKHLIHVYAEHKAFFQESPKKLYYHWMPFVKTLPHCPINKSGFPKDSIAIDVYCDNYEDAIDAALLYT